MGFRKHTQAEKIEVLSPEEHKQVQEELHFLGKTSARDLSEEDRQEIFKDPLDDSE